MNLRSSVNFLSGMMAVSVFEFICLERFIFHKSIRSAHVRARAHIHDIRDVRILRILNVLTLCKTKPATTKVKRFRPQFHKQLV